MPKHISKMEDGHFLVETDEEYKKRTGGGFLRTIAAIIAVIFIVFTFFDKDDENSTKAPAAEGATQESEVKASVPTKPVETEKTVTNNNVATFSEEVVDDTPVVIEEPIVSEAAAENSDADKSHETEINAVDIEASVKKVNELYKSATAAIKDGDNDAALKALEEMKAIQAEMPKKVNRINDKIKSLEKKLK